MDHIKDILARNARVEAEKAWEVSWTRRLLIGVMTYVIATVFLYNIGNEDFLLNALVPCGGYLLSTVSLPVVKRWWMGRLREIHG